MAGVKHALVSVVVDDGVAGEVGPSEWNADHVLDDLTDFATANSDGAVALYNSIYNFYRGVTGTNATEGAFHVRLNKTADANPTGGHYALGASVEVTGGSLDHFATVYAYFQGTGTLFNTGFGFQAHMWASTAGQGLIGLAGHMELNNGTSNSGTALYGADLFTAVAAGSSSGATGIGLNVGVRGSGWASGSYNAILGRGTVSGENWGASFRGFSSRTSNNGMAKMDLTIIDLGGGGAAAFFDCTDVRLLVGYIIKLADQSLASFILQDSAGGTLFSVVADGTATGSILATQANQETGTAVTKLVTSGRQHFHPSAAKFWVKATGASTTIVVSYNMTSWANTGTGDADGTIATDFSGANWCGVVTTLDAGTDGWDADSIQSAGFNAQDAGTFGVLCGFIIDGGTAAAALTNPDQWMVCGFGDQ